MPGRLDIAWWLKRKRREAYQRSLMARGWYDPHARSEADAIFIGGCGRSGTTLFKQLLNRHSRLACGPETSLYGLPFNPANIGPYWDIPVRELERRARAHRNLITFADEFYEEFLRVEGKKRWADKTPNNVRVVMKLLTWYPRGRFIHVIRDGRDTVCSLRHHPKEKVVNGRIVPVKVNNPIAKCAQRWVDDTSDGLALRSHPRCLEVRYEELVAEPEQCVRRVCDFLGEPYEPAMLEPSATPKSSARTAQVLNNPNADNRISPQSVGRWRKELSPDERREFVSVAGELLIALGYVTDHSWMHEPMEPGA
ncbi:MAG: sulfotransferase [Phycisphaeraceae bacterium]|nr:MAG: sulfotransferase [Phycisphaeraceae bacterium]